MQIEQRFIYYMSLCNGKIPAGDYRVIDFAHGLIAKYIRVDVKKFVVEALILISNKEQA